MTLAQSISKENITARVNYFGRIEAELIQSPDQDFKFHSGIPVT
ncbi:MiaE [Xenorhabdus nematophila AN6/1]|nr:MiaE [Xenorhabdus nematophila AN6/1]